MFEVPATLMQDILNLLGATTNSKYEIQVYVNVVDKIRALKRIDVPVQEPAAPIEDPTP